MSKKQLNAGVFTYNTAGECENPETLLDNQGEQIQYTLLISQCNTGWLFGYRLAAPDKIIESACRVENGICMTKAIAEKNAAEFAHQFFFDARRSIETHITSDIDPLFKLLKKHKSELARKKVRNAPDHEELDKIAEPGREAITVLQAIIKDDYCNYHYVRTDSGAKGFKHKVDGTGIIEDDLRNALLKLNVHLAALDDVFKVAGITIRDIEKMQSHELTLNYQATGIMITGEDHTMRVQILGNKFVSAGGRCEVKTIPVILDNLSSYKWTNQLRDAVDTYIEEVIMYHQGKYTLPDDDDINDADQEGTGKKKKSAKQLRIDEDHPEAE